MRPITLAAGLALLLGAIPAAAEPPSAEDLVNAMEGVSGAHAGKRRSGARGLCATGEFVGSGGGVRYSKAAHLVAGARSPAIARFSIGGGNPHSSDTAAGTRGLALALDVPGNEDYHLVFISAPVFGFSTPEAMVEVLRSRAPDPATGQPNPERVAAANAKHPNAGAAQAAYIRANGVSTSYATAPYFSVNTFIFTNAAGTQQPARITFEPAAGRAALTEDQRRTLPSDFLWGELVERVGRGPAEWRALLQLPRPGDPLLDATVAWPDDREQVEIGTLRITAVSPVGQAGDCEPMMFDPMRLPAGIDPSDDPILNNRSAPYAVSLSRRNQ